MTKATLVRLEGAVAPNAETIHGALHFCRTAADDARAHAREDGCSDELSRRISGHAFLANLPELTNIGSVQAYIACVALALSLGYVSGREARLCLHAAKLALAAMHQGGAR